MRFKKFDVVELKNENRAVILAKDNKEYYAEILDNYGNTLEHKNISTDEIKRVIFSKGRER